MVISYASHCFASYLLNSEQPKSVLCLFIYCMALVRQLYARCQPWLKPIKLKTSGD